MFQKSSILFYHCLSSLHVGSGSSVGTIDLPIQREKYTNFPVMAGSGVKGCMREYFEGKDPQKVETVFGPDTDSSDYAGALSFSDGKILLFPVKSVKDVFAWVTCPLVIERYNRDMKIVKADFKPLPLPEVREEFAAVGKNCSSAIEKNVVLEDFEFMLNYDDKAQAIAEYFADAVFEKNSYWHSKLSTSLIILTDTAFKDFVEYSTEVQTRIKINNKTGTVDTGALFYEENLPSESILYGMTMASHPHTDKGGEELKDAQSVMNFVRTANGKVVQMGGDATIGKGLIEIKFID